MKAKIYVNYHTLRILSLSVNMRYYRLFFFEDIEEPVQEVNTGLGDTELQLN